MPGWAILPWLKGGPWPPCCRPGPPLLPDGFWGVPLDAVEWHADRALGAAEWHESRHMRSCQEMSCHSMLPSGTRTAHSAPSSGTVGPRGPGARNLAHSSPRTPDPVQAPEAGGLRPQATPSHIAREDRSAGGTTARAASWGCPIPAIERVCKACAGAGPTCGGAKHTCAGAGPTPVLHR